VQDDEWLADAVYLPQERAIVALSHTLVSPNTYIEKYPSFLRLIKLALTGRILWRTTVCGAEAESLFLREMVALRWPTRTQAQGPRYLPHLAA
jgi:hypothetical protein